MGGFWLSAVPGVRPNGGFPNPRGNRQRCVAEVECIEPTITPNAVVFSQRVEHIVEFAVLILIVAALVGGVVWHHHTKSVAAAGVEFSVPEPPDRVVRAISDAYCQGTKAILKSALSRITVKQSGPASFHFSSRLGDTGQVDIVAASGNAAIVRARTTEFFIGTPPAARFRKGILGLSSWITHGIYTMLGIAPHAVKMKRFQRGLERRVQRQLARASAKGA